MTEELNEDEKAIIEKARNMASETIPLGGDKDGPTNTSPTSPSTPSTATDEETLRWGPYADGEYHTITPPWGGLFGVPAGQVLYFQEKEIFSRRENTMKQVKIARRCTPESEEWLVNRINVATV